MYINAKILKYLLIQQNMNWTELSKKSGISKTHLSRMINSKERINLRFTTINALSTALGVEYKFIIKGAD